MTKEELEGVVRKMIDESGLTNYKIAKGADIGAIILTKWFRGDTKPTLATLTKMYTFLNGYLNGDPQPTTESLANQLSTDLFAKVSRENFKLVPLVQKLNIPNYIKRHVDESFIHSLPNIPLRLDESFKGKYMCFEMEGDSMNNGSTKSLLNGDIILGREIKREAWSYDIQPSSYYFIVVTKTQLSICRMLEQNVHGREFVCSSINPIYGEKYAIRMSEVTELYHAVKIVERSLRL